MVFSSIQFLCAFLPVLFCVYTALSFLKTPRRTDIQNWLLLIFSSLFYAYGEPVYILLLLASALFNYLFAMLVSPGRKSGRKAFLIIAVCVNLLLLGVFKYTGMLVSTLDSILGLSLPVPEIALPIGISFFTFQALSYVIDVYRGDAAVQKDYSRMLLYITFFPQLIAGPIVKFHEIDKELAERTQTVTGVAHGLRRFIIGLAKKVLISNTLAVAADAVFSVESSALSAASAWIGAAAYMLQIYYDFSGYSDMALGMGEMFGFHFCENFEHPYCSDSIRMFWRRWHISLSSWFRDYLYIPLGGNRKGKLRTGINKLIVFFCTGLWHGASWTFVIWGLYHGAFLMLEEYVPVKKQPPKLLRHIYALAVVCVGFVIFRADTIGQAWHVIGSMFAGWRFGPEQNALTLSLLTPLFIFVLLLAAFGSADIRRPAHEICEKAGISREAQSVLSYVGALALLVLCICSLSGSTYNPFIYFRF